MTGRYLYSKSLPFFAVLLIALAFCFGGCQKAAIKKTTKAKPVKVLRVSVSGMVTPKETFDQYDALLKYIAIKTGRKYELLQRKTYAEVNQLVKDNKVDVAFVCTGAYLPAKRDCNAELLAVPVVREQPLYYSYIIVPQDSAAKEFGDLNGKKFAFTDALSNTGKLYPTYLTAAAGRNPDTFFSSTIFTYNHDNSIRAVQQKTVDGAAVDSLIFDYLAAKRPAATQGVRVLQKSPAFGIPPVIVNADMDPALKAELKKILFGLDKDPAGRKILKNLMIDRFQEGDEANYQSVADMEKYVQERGIQ